MAALLVISVPEAEAVLKFQLACVRSVVFVFGADFSFSQPVPAVRNVAAMRSRVKYCFFISLDLLNKIGRFFLPFNGFLPDLVPYFQPFTITANYLHSSNS